MVETQEHEPGTSLNIVLLPDQRTTEQAMSLSQAVSAQYGVEFALDQQMYRPHITIYQGLYPDRNLSQLFEQLRQFVSAQRSTEISMDGFQTMVQTFLFWNCQKTAALQSLHDRILATANPLREGQLPPSVVVLLPELSAEDRNCIAETGGILNGPRFQPHITITRLQNPLDADRAVELVSSIGRPMTFTADRIVVGHLGPHGTVSTTVKEMAFRS